MEAQELYLEQSKTVQTKTNNNRKHDSLASLLVPMSTRRKYPRGL